MFLKKIAWKKIFVFCLLTLFFCAFQTTAWYQLLQISVSPNLWLMVIVFTALNRERLSAFIEGYLFGIIVHSFSVIPVGFVWLLIAAITGTILIIKNRVYWDDWRYFTMTVFGAVVLKNILEPLYGWIFAISSPAILGTRFSEIILTTAFAAPIYFVLKFVDQWMSPDYGRERDAVSFDG